MKKENTYCLGLLFFYCLLLNCFACKNRILIKKIIIAGIILGRAVFRIWPLSRFGPIPCLPLEKEIGP